MRKLSYSYSLFNLFQKRKAKVTVGNQIPYLRDDDLTEKDKSSNSETKIEFEKKPPSSHDCASDKSEESGIRTMGELEKQLRTSHDWAVERIDTLGKDEDAKDAQAIHSEFEEWLDPSIPEHDVFSLEYLGDKNRQE